jgi:hypothetical protein
MKGSVMRKLNKLLVPTLLATALFTGASSASPTSTYATWAWDGLYVRTYVAYNTGDIGASFENSSGTLFTSWNNSSGVNQCPGQPTLRLASAYGAAPEIQKILLAAALAHKPLKVWFEATDGICYIKQITATM